MSSPEIHASLPKPPELPTRAFFGHLQGIRHQPLQVFSRAAQLNKVVRLRVGQHTVVLVTSAEDARRVLQDNVKNYSKQTRGYAQLRRLLGQGLVTSEGSFWLRQRRIAQPAFHRQRITGFGATMVRLGEETLSHWAAREPGAEVDLNHEMMALTLRVVGWTLLSTEVSHDSGVVGTELPFLLEEMVRRATTFFNPPLFVPTPSNVRFNRARRALDQVVHEIILARRASEQRPDDLLTLLMETRDEDTGEQMSDGQLRDEVMTLFLAGHETTANALTWTFYLLSKHPEVEARLHAELQAVLGGRSPTAEDLPRLVYTGQVLHEAMRLYPPVWILMRRAEGPDTLGGHRIEPGNFVAVLPYVNHRDPEQYPDPERFDPERFTPERMKTLPRFAYLPFSGGPRGCIGNNFALLEATLLLSTLAQRFRMELTSGEPLLHPTITLRPKDPIRMRLHLRT